MAEEDRGVLRMIVTGQSLSLLDNPFFQGIIYTSAPGHSRESLATALDKKYDTVVSSLSRKFRAWKKQFGSFLSLLCDATLLSTQLCYSLAS